MLRFTTAHEVNAFIHAKKLEGLSVGFIPTMGALHEGHLSMVRKSGSENGLTVVSIFVNPIQFNNPADLEKYPRTLEKDIELLTREGCDLVFIPTVEEMYPAGEKSWEPELGGLDLVMEGKFRPGHFRGVAIVVKKFFDIIEPDVAYFGKKDFQQLAIIQYMVKSNNMVVRIIPSDTVREPDGLAMSSRNLRLEPGDRTLAPKIHEVLQWARSQAGKVPPRELEKLAIVKLEEIRGFQPEYFEIVDAATLLPVKEWEKGRPAVACTAVFVGNIRLIDNMEVFS